MELIKFLPRDIFFNFHTILELEYVVLILYNRGRQIPKKTF